METMDLKSLTAAQKMELMQQLEAEQKAEKAKKQAERDTYEQLKNAQVQATFKRLTNISSELEKSKQSIFDEFDTILKMKKELFDITDDRMLAQESHTFTTTDGSVSIIIGHNVRDSWDETVDVGVEKVNQWLVTLAKDEPSAMLVGLIRDLLKPNKDGVLKAPRVLELSKKAKELGDRALIDAVELIESAYRPVKTSTYVKAKFKDERGQWQWLALSMSAA
jgi:hypothetical protein